jgi:hypothetical protein
MGRTPGNRKVIVPANRRLIGECLPVRITDASVTTLSGELCLAGVDASGIGVLAQ